MLRPLVLLLATLAPVVACSIELDGTTSTSTTSTTASGGGSVATTGSGGGQDGGAGGTEDSGLGTYCAPDAVTTTPVGANAILVETAHYALTAETDPATAEDLARLLEASWDGFGEYFEGSPELAANERLDVRYFATAEAWATAIAADGGVVPQNAGGLFLPSSRRAYLYDQKNPYFNQVLLVHEAAHQFHLLGRAKGQSLPFWYVEGIAEHLSRHDWDGRCARLGRVPLLNWDDMPEAALDEANDGKLDVTALTSGDGTPTRAASWALVHYLEHGAPLAQRDGFDAFRKAFDEGAKDASATFESLVGDTNALASPLEAWLPSVQQPMRPIFLEWVHRSPTSVLAFSPGYFSLAVVKAKPSHFEVTYDVPESSSWKVGVVLGYDDPMNFKGIVVDQAGALSTFTYASGQGLWNGAGKAPPTLDDAHGTIAVDLVAGGAQLTVNGATSTHDPAFTPTVGLAVDDSRVLFRDLAWQ
jgi:hypothetical protein